MEATPTLCGFDQQRQDFFIYPLSQVLAYAHGTMMASWAACWPVTFFPDFIA